MDVAIAIAANVLLGIVLLGLFVWRRPALLAPLADEAAALQAFRGHFPDAERTVLLGADGETALLTTASADSVGLVQRHGHRWNVRDLQPGDLAAVSEAGDTLTLRLRDFGWPRCRVRITDPQRRAECLERLRGLASSTPGGMARA